MVSNYIKTLKIALLNPIMLLRLTYNIIFLFDFDFIYLFLNLFKIWENSHLGLKMLNIIIINSN